MKHIDGYAGEENSDIRDFLLRIGGSNPAGFPNFRLVESDKVFERKGGNWHDWDENLDVADRSPVLRKTVHVRQKVVVPGPNREIEVVIPKSIVLPGNAPIRVVAEVRTVQKYAHLDVQGWILERFYPSELYGAQEDWYSRVVPGTSVPLMGPYPVDGQYEMVAGVFPKAPSHSFLQQFLAFHAKRSREMQERDVRCYVNEATHRAQKAEEKKRSEAEARIRDLISPLLGTSLEAGRWRNEVAQKAGIRSHMGN